MKSQEMTIETALEVAGSDGYSEVYKARAIEVLATNSRRYQYLREFGIKDTILASTTLWYDELDAVIDAALERKGGE